MGALIDPPHYYMCKKCHKVMKSDILTSGNFIVGSCPTCKQIVVRHKDCGGLCTRTEGNHISY